MQHPLLLPRRPEESGQPAGQQHQQGLWQHAGLKFGDFEVDFPLALQLKHGLTAQPDVQLQLFSVRAGSEAAQHRGSGSSARRVPPAADRESPTMRMFLRFEAQSMWRQCGDSAAGPGGGAHVQYAFSSNDAYGRTQYLSHSSIASTSAGALVTTKNTAALAFLGLLFPEHSLPWLSYMAVAGMVSSVFVAGRRSAASRRWHLPGRPSLHVNLGEHDALRKRARTSVRPQFPS